jgi:hypothetical protein
MESGRVKVKEAKVFATANEISRLSKPLQSRFRRLFLPSSSRKSDGPHEIELIMKTIEIWN